MLRRGSQIKNKVGNWHRVGQNARGLSTDASSGSGRTVAVAGAIVLAGGAAAVGAAWQIPSFRKTVEQNVPPTKYLFNPILGPLENSAVSEIVIPKPAKKRTDDVFESPMREAGKRKENADIKVDQQEVESTSVKPTDSEKSDSSPRSESVTQEVKEDILPLLEESSISVPPPPPIEEIKPKEEIVEVKSWEGEVAEANVENTAEKENTVEKEEPAESPVEEEESKNGPPSSTLRSPEEVAENIIKLEEDILANEAAASAILQDSLSSCAQRCAEAIESNKEATEAISLHTSLLRKAMDDTKVSSDEKNTQWMDLSGMLEQKSRLQNEAESLSQNARQEISKLEAVIEELKKSNSSGVMQKIIDAEEYCNAMRREVEETAKEMNVKLSESHVISQYKDLIDTAKEQFRQELLSVMPDVNPQSGWRKLGEKLSNDDLNALIAHAHRRVDQLQRELAEERAISTSRMEMAVQAARERWEEHATVETEKKLEVLKRESEIEHDKKLEEARQAFENEMRVQLKRQAAAHSDHLTDMLAIQEKQIRNELCVEFEQKLLDQEQKFLSDMENVKSRYEEELHELTEKFQFSLNKALAKVAGIESAVDGRAYIENESRKAQELWLACEALRIAVQYGCKGGPVPLQKELQAITQVPGIEPHVIEIVKAFPERASQRGVFTEATLRSAYAQVSKACRRLSLISETRNSFFDYFLSYLKSLLIISRAKTEPPEDLDPNNLDTFSILSYAAYCLEQGDLEQATRFLNQLTGESRRVAEGWLEEARLLLETKQVVDVLSSLASATSIAANLEV